MKKTWTQPEVKELEIKNTEFGNELKTTPDATYNDGQHTYYSFS